MSFHTPISDAKRKNALRFMGIPWVTVDETKLPRRRPQTAGLRTPPTVSTAELPHLEGSPTRPLFSNNETQFTDDECLQISVATEEEASSPWRPPSRLSELRQSRVETSLIVSELPSAPEPNEEESQTETLPELPRCDSIVSMKAEDPCFDVDDRPIHSRNARKRQLAMSGPVTPAEIQSHVWQFCAETNPEEPGPLRLFQGKIVGKTANVTPTGGRRRIVSAMNRSPLMKCDRDLLMTPQPKTRRARAEARERLRTLETCYSAQRFKGFMEKQMVPTPGFMENVRARADAGKRTRIRPKSLPLT